MRRIIISIFAAAVSVIAVISCNAGGFSTDSGFISVSAGLASDGKVTKALLEPEQLFTSGTEVKFYGLAFDRNTSVPLDIPGHIYESAGSTKLNDGQPVRYDGSGWTYASGEAYQWRAGADHRFFGWLDKDALSGLTAAGFFTGMSYDPSLRKLTIPAKALTISETGLDFAFSDVVVRDASAADYSTVSLDMKHLFASFSVAAHNYTSSGIVVKSVRLYGIRNSKGAVITFGDASSTVSYTGGATVYDSGEDCFELITEVSGIALSPDEHKTNIVKGASDEHKYFLMWPQTAEELTAESSSDTEFIPVGDNPAYMKITYSQNGGADMTVNIRIPFDVGTGWAAGTRRNMELSFFEKKIVVGVYAANWEETEPVVDYNGAIAVTDHGKLRVSDDCNCVKSDDGKTIYFKPGWPVILEFKIDQPVNSTWLVSKTGDFDVFDIDNYDDPSVAVLGDGLDTAEGVIVEGNTRSRIAIYPRISEMQKSEYKINLAFYVRLNNGEMTSINDLILDDESPETFILLKD